MPTMKYPKTPVVRQTEQLLFQITTDLQELRRLIVEDGQAQARAQARTFARSQIR